MPLKSWWYSSLDVIFFFGHILQSLNILTSFLFKTPIMSWSKQRAPPSSFIRISLISGQAKKEVRTMLMDQPEHFSGDSRALRAAPCRANNWLVVFSASKHLRCQLHRWLRALNAHIWLLQLEVSLLLKPAVAYSHSLVCLPIQNHNADWFIVGAIRRNLCGHVDGGKPLCLKCLEL